MSGNDDNLTTEMDDESQQQEQQQQSGEVPTDPYVIYQLRKPSQRGTAVIPRFVPNTHAPAFSPANYRFARVWPDNDPTLPATSTSKNSVNNNGGASGIYAPRSFEYVGSLGSESSVWSETSSWVSVSSLRTAPSEVRTPLLQQHQPPSISAAEFFNKQDSSNSTNMNTKHLKQHHRQQQMKMPSALSESISEDALVDDLLSQPQNLRPSNFSSTHSRKADTVNVEQQHSDNVNSKERVKSRRQSSSNKDSDSVNNMNVKFDKTTNNYSNKSTPYYQQQHQRQQQHHDNDDEDSQNTNTKFSFLPFRTRKRRSLWQWLFCADPHTTARSVTTSVKTVTTTTAIALPAPEQPNGNKRQTKQNEKELKIEKLTSNENINNNNKFLNGGNRRVTELGNNNGKRNTKLKPKRSPSFEIRRGKPNNQNQQNQQGSRRSMSWNFDPRSLFGFDTSNSNKDTNRRRSDARRSSNNDEQPQQKTRLQRSSSKKLSREAAHAVAERFKNRFSIERNNNSHNISNSNSNSNNNDKINNSNSKNSDNVDSSNSNTRGQYQHPSNDHHRHEINQSVSQNQQHINYVTGKSSKGHDQQINNLGSNTIIKRDEKTTTNGRINNNKISDERNGRRASTAYSHHGVSTPTNFTTEVQHQQPNSSSYVNRVHSSEQQQQLSSHTNRTHSTEHQPRISSRISSDLSSRTGASTHSFPSVIPRSAGPNEVGSATEMNEDMIMNGLSTDIDVTSHVSVPIANQRNLHRQSSPSPVNNLQIRQQSSSTNSFPDHHHLKQQYNVATDINSTVKVNGSSVRRKQKVNNVNENRKRHQKVPDSVAKKMEQNRIRTQTQGPLSYLTKPPSHIPSGHNLSGSNDNDINTGSSGLTSIADESVSTHKTFNEDHEKYDNPYNNHKESTPAKIFQNSPLVTSRTTTTTANAKTSHTLNNVNGNVSKYTNPYTNNSGSTNRHDNNHNHVNGNGEAASPRRFHSDWSDPHATDIDKFCQCNCSCVYEEECRRSCDLVYGRSPSVSSTRSCGRKGIDSSGSNKMKSSGNHNGKHKSGSHVGMGANSGKHAARDNMGITEEEPNVLMNGKHHAEYAGHAYVHSGQGHTQFVNGRVAGTNVGNHGVGVGTGSGSSNRVVEKSEKTLLRASELDELPDLPSGRRSAQSQESQPRSETQVVNHHHGNNISGNLATKTVERKGRRMVDVDRFGRSVAIEERRQRGESRSSTPRPMMPSNTGSTSSPRYMDDEVIQRWVTKAGDAGHTISKRSGGIYGKVDSTTTAATTANRRRNSAVSPRRKLDSNLKL